jgi:deazaflavin-dependent oxidoreductase (nitroreductase family)
MDRLRPVRRLTAGLEATQVKRLGRSGLSLVARTPVLVLETTGRKSGRRRETTLAYLALDGEQLLVVGGAGGQTRLPDWVANLRADPTVAVTLNRVRRPMDAHELDGAEREAAWAKALDAWPRVESYESRAGRPVPVVRLTPRAQDSTTAEPSRRRP